MWPSQFEYVRPNSVEEAVQILNSNGDAKIIAGGHSLLPAMKLRLSSPAMLVDISRLSALKSISANGSLQIGAMSTHSDVAMSREVNQYCKALASAAGKIGDQTVRNWGTIGGNLAHADPASDPPTVIVAAGGKLHLQGSGGKRVVDAENFFSDLFTTDLQDGEIVTAIEVPNLSGMKSAYAKLQHPASRYAVVGVALFLEVDDGGTCKSARVAVGGSTARATRSHGAENALAGSRLDDAALNAAAEALKQDVTSNPLGDMNFPEDYRLAMSGVYFKRAVKEALSS